MYRQLRLCECFQPHDAQHSLTRNLNHMLGARLMSVSQNSQPSQALPDWWVVEGETCLAAYDATWTSSLETTYNNLANPGTYTISSASPPTLSNGLGWVFDGNDDYLDTTFIPAYTMTIIVAFADLTKNGEGVLSYAYLYGVTESTPTRRYVMNFVDYFGSGKGFLIAHGDDGSVGTYTVAGNPSSISGVYAQAQRSSYYDGVYTRTIAAPSIDAMTRSMVLGAHRNAANALEDFTQVTIKAVACYDDALSSADIAALATRMAAL